MKKVSREVKVIEPRAIYLHCYGHSLNLAVSDIIKSMSDTPDYYLEICKLIKFSPRRDAIFNKTLGRAQDPCANGACLSKLTE